MKVCKLISTFTLFLLTSLVGFSPRNIAFSQSEFAYAYFIVAEDRNTQLQIVSQIDRQAIPVVIPSGRHAPFQAFVSPQGDWIVLPLLATNQRDYLIQLLNPSSGEYRDIATGLLSGNLPSIYSLQNVEWSPDGRFLALNVASRNEQGRDDLDILLYSLEDGGLTDITNDEVDQFRLAWSPNSSHLVTSTVPCVGSDCVAQLDIFDGMNNIPSNTIDLPPVPPYYAPICQLNWSPDGRYIGFMAICDETSPNFPKEVYLWDTMQSTIISVTMYTHNGTGLPEGIANAIYDMLWIDAQTLLVGASIQINAEPVSTEVVSYDVSTTSSKVVTAQYAVRNLEANPVSGQLAFQMIEEPEDIVDAYQGNKPIRITAPNVVLPDALAIADSSSTIVTPAGCEAVWSPDGSTLAIIVRAGDNCRANVESIVFVDAETGELREHIIRADPTIERIVPIGWLAG